MIIKVVASCLASYCITIFYAAPTFVTIIFIVVTSLTALIRETSVIMYHLPCNSPLFSLYKHLKINLEPIFIPIMLALCLMLHVPILFKITYAGIIGWLLFGYL